DAIRSRLAAAREKRPRPARDDKILTDTNALFCTALARAGRVLRNPAYVSAASRAMQFLFASLRDENGHLLHRYRDRVSGIPAFADDYAYTIAALIELYEASFEIAYIRDALTLNSLFVTHFRDAAEGGFFTTSDTAGDLPVRKKEWYDGAIPSANAVAFDNLMRLSRLTGDAMLEEAASACARFIAGAAARSPSAVAGFLAALACSPRTGAAQDLVIAGDPAHPGTRALLDAPGTRYLPGLLVLHRPPGAAGEEVETVAPIARGREDRGGRAMAYLCSGSTCLVPVNTPEELLNNLRGGKGRKATP
ncbi:MAG: thioredoxin domain-containing protein, partial [Methanoregula sp.]